MGMSAAGYNPLYDRLQSGESLLWSGQPERGGSLMRGGWLMIPFSILWLGFALFWESSVIASGAPVFFWLWGMPFILIGIYNLVGRYWVAAREAARTYYGVTDRRILIQSGAFRPQTTSLDLATLPHLQLTQESNGRGTIYFSPPAPFGNWMGGSTFGNRYQVIAFQNIADAESVYTTISNARRGQEPGAPTQRF